MDNIILVSDWEQVDSDDFYLSDRWKENVGEEVIEKAREFQRGGRLYVGYLVSATNYAVYRQMDADQVFIDPDGEVIMRCETAIISNSCEHGYRRKLDE